MRLASRNPAALDAACGLFPESATATQDRTFYYLIWVTKLDHLDRTYANANQARRAGSFRYGYDLFAIPGIRSTMLQLPLSFSLKSQMGHSPRVSL
jgi:hypothetical protein